MTVWNGADFVSEAIESVLGQTFTDLELIVVNDGSTDSTENILEGYETRDDRVQIVTQERRGVVLSANRGCGLARGRYLARLDADDVALPERLAEQVAFLDSHPETAAVGGAVVFSSFSGKPASTVQYPATDRAIRDALPYSCPLLHSAATMRRAAFDAVGGYRLRPYAEDYDLWLRLATRFRLANLPAAVVRYRVHPGQISGKNLRQLAACTLAARAAARQRAKSDHDPLPGIVDVTSQTLAVLGVAEVEVAREEVTLGLWYAKTLFATGATSDATRLFRTLQRRARADASTPDLLPLILEEEARCHHRDRKRIRARLVRIRAWRARQRVQRSG